MGSNKWQTSDVWPPAGAQPMTFHLASGGRANSLNGDGQLTAAPPDADTPDVFTYDPTNPVTSYGGNVCCTGNAIKAGSFDQRKMESRHDVLVYTSEPFKDGLEVSGPITPTLYVSSDAKDTDFTVKVLDVYPDGRAYNLDESIQRMRYRDGYEKKVWMEKDKVYKVTLQPLTTSNYFARRPPAAHRSVEQQLPALRSQPEYRRQQLRRGEGRRRAQRRPPLEAVPVEHHDQRGAPIGRDRTPMTVLRLPRLLACAAAVAALMAWPAPLAAQPAARVTVLYDAFGNPSDLRKDWGFSALIEYGGRRILFDTGNNADFFKHNVERLRIDLSRLDAAVISHRHGDHTTGISYLLERNPSVRIYTPQEGATFKSTAPPAFVTPKEGLPPNLSTTMGRAAGAIHDWVALADSGLRSHHPNP